MFGTVGEDFLDIAAGDSFCIVRHEKVLWAWGRNDYGELGDNSRTHKTSPVSVSFTLGVSSLLAQSFVKKDGKYYAWGDNTYGQLGDNSRTSHSVPTEITDSLRLDPWGESVFYTTAGTYHSLAIRGSDGLLYAWGYNAYGQLGDNSITNRSVPTSVSSADSWIAVAAGSNHSLAIRGSDGKAYAWGYNLYGQLGNNSITDRSIPTSVSSADSWVAVAAGTTHSLAIRGSDGLLYAWGRNNYGQLGDNSTTDRSIPTSVSSADSWVAVAAGTTHSLAIRGSDGKAYAWGNNAYGQLGDNSRTDRSIPTSVSSADSWVAVAVAAGVYHSLAIRGSDGKAYAWGYNLYGQLGDNSRTSRSVPTSVSSADSWIAVAAGTTHSLAIRGSDGKAYAWGYNYFGQLGDNSTTSRSVPTSVSSADSWIAVAAGAYHSLAIRDSDGKAYAWGNNTYGELGNNSITNRSVPVIVLGEVVEIVCMESTTAHTISIIGNGLLYAWGRNNFGQLGDNSTTSKFVPTSVSSADSWIAVAAGAYHSLAIRGSDGLLYAWGYNNCGQLGNNSITDRSVPTSVSSADSWVAVAAGVYHSLAIRGSDGKAYAWGYNLYGQLGDNSRTSRSVPTSVSSADSWVAVAAGTDHSLAIRGSDGKAYAWGYNNYGQLGDNSTTSRSVPTSVSSAASWKKIVGFSVSSCGLSDGACFSWGSGYYGVLGDNDSHLVDSLTVPTSVSSADSWIAVAAGSNHSLAIRGSDGKAYAWGYNAYGQLGDNSITNRSVPTSVSSADSWIAVAAGAYHSLAIRGSDGLLYAWGYNNCGQLGDNSTTDRSIPTSVSSADSWVAVAAGTTHSLAIRGSDGLLYAWGRNNYGQLGDNSITNRSVPTSVSSADSWVAVAAGVYHSLAIRGSDGKAYAWGNNAYGQLGDNSRTSKSVPTSVSSADSWIAVAAGTTHSLAIRGSDGKAYAWGYNNYGQLGDNSRTSRSVPTSVSSADSWIAVAAGISHSLAIRGSDGKAYAWGYNLGGQLGDNSTTSRSVPTSVSSADSWIAVAAGAYHSLAIRDSDGKAYAWGNNTYGELGVGFLVSHRSVPALICKLPG